MTASRELLDSLAHMKGARFASFLYRNGKGELSRYRVLLGASFQGVYEKDRDYLLEHLNSFTGLDKVAATAILNSIEESLTKGVGLNSRYVHGPDQGDTYLHFQGDGGAVLPGVTYHKDQGCLHVKALVIGKTVLEAVEEKPVKSAPLTLAKREIESQLRRGSIREFKFTRLKVAKLNGDTIEFISDPPM